MKKKRDQSKPLPKKDPEFTMNPTSSDKIVMKKHGLTERLKYDDITTYEDDITPFRIWSVMNNEWLVYEELCDKVRKLDNLDDEIILKKLTESLQKHGWISGFIAVVFDDGWHLTDGRHRFACAYALGIDCFIKPRIFKPEFKSLKNHSIPVFNYLSDEIVNNLKMRYKILQMLRNIKNKHGRNNIFSSTYKIPSLGIYGRDCGAFIEKHKEIIKDKTVLQLQSSVGYLCIEIAKYAHSVFGIDNDQYNQVSNTLLRYFNNKNVVFDKFTNEKFDIVIGESLTEAQSYLKNNGLFINGI